MAKSVNSRKGVNRKRWNCPNHPKAGLRKTVKLEGKFCPTCFRPAVPLNWMVSALNEQ